MPPIKVIKRFLDTYEAIESGAVAKGGLRLPRIRRINE
jgi:hypothetical protein